MGDQPVSEDVRNVFVRANEQAHDLGHRWVGGEHVLYGLASAPGAVGEILRDRGVTALRVQAELVRLTSPTWSATAQRASLFDRIDGDALSTIGIDLDQVRARIEAAFGAEALTLPQMRPQSRAFARFRPRERSAEPLQKRGLIVRLTRPGNRGHHLPMTRRTRVCLVRAEREMQRLKSERIGVEHLALALLSDDGGVPPIILRKLGVSPARLRAQILSSVQPAT
ncbi:MAG TPA: Clp protease N-terminal domain-containing protein [Actinocrinis sp.]|jgi:ATP-dependent Clp protease ATP-binding subunit ClpA